MTRLFGYIRGLHATYVMDLGVQLGLFTALAAAPREPEELAAALGLHPFYVRKWCETAYSLELLEWARGQGYLLGPHIGDLLANPDHTYYMGGFPTIHLRVAEDYAHYAQRFRDGGTKPYQAHDSAFFGAVADGLRTLPLMLLDVLAAELPGVQEKMQAGGHLLDIGCGAGAAVCEFAARFPALHCLGVDVEPQSLQLARTAIAARGLGDRAAVQQVAADAPYPDNFDLATMFLVLHELDPAIKGSVLRRCHAALRPGGLLLILDEAYPDSQAGLRDPAVAFSVMAQWFEMTWGNVVNTRAEIQGMLAAAGFALLAETHLSRFYIVVAEKR